MGLGPQTARMSWFRKPRPVESPVLVVDALGVSERIASCDSGALSELADELDQQFYSFSSRLPNRLVIATRSSVFSSRQFSSLRLNDMFVAFSTKAMPDPVLGYLVAASMLYHQLLLAGFIARGGLGFGTVLRRRDMILGNGFLDAYRASERRSDLTKHVCAIEVTPRLLAQIPNCERAWRLLCFYNDRFFVNPTCLVDPDMGEFTAERILGLLKSSGVNGEKRSATAEFLEKLEDYDAASRPGSRSRDFTRRALSDER